ncbi:MAG: hypothetical protein JWP31_270 [Aeromicrobium sp.]|nr:hypothetical protein [Aeromicrobium sp.]
MKKLLLVLLPILLVAACAGGTPRDDASDHNAADVAFTRGMIPHHEQAVEMARLVDGAGASSDVTRLAAQIEAAQAPEIAQMRGWLDDWDEPATGGHDMGSHDMNMGDGMLTGADMRELGRARGAEFDRLWLTGMIGHHEGAVEMAETVLDEGKDPATRKLARAIIAAQQDEITEMKGLLR